MNEKILITGGAGYIGSHFIKELEKKDYNPKNILVVDNLSNGFKDNIRYGNFVEIDLRDKKEVKRIVSEFKPDTIAHFAAFISVPESVKKPIKYYENNFIGSLNLISAAIENNVKKFVFSSTAAVYGIPKKVLVSEDTVLKPINPYGNSKKMVEELLKDTKKANPSFNYACLRYFNVAGKGFDVKQKDAKNLIPIIISRIKKDKKEIDIFGNDWDTKDGTCIRDYIHVVDLVRAHLAVIPLLNKKSYTFNVGYGEGYSVLNVVNAFEDELDLELKKNFVGRREGDPEALIADNKKILKETDWKPMYADLNIIVRSAWNGKIV